MFNNVGKGNIFKDEYGDYSADDVELSNYRISEVAPDLVEGLEDVLSILSGAVKKLKAAVDSKDPRKIYRALEDAYYGDLSHSSVSFLYYGVESVYRKWRSIKPD